MVHLNLSKTKAFIKKDFIIESSYKIAFVITLINSTFPVISYFFVGKLVSNKNTALLEKYGNDYFDFVLIGIAFSNYFIVSINTFSSVIKRAQMAGCLEAILSSQTDPRSVVLLSSFYSFLSALVQLLIAFAIGVFFFHFSLGRMNIPSTLVIFILSMFVFIGLGILSAAGIILFKQAEPVSWAISAVTTLLCGAIYPVRIMPLWLQYISALIPVSYSLEGMRLAILQDYSLDRLLTPALVLFFSAVIIFPVSLYIFDRMVEKGKREGTLMQY
jgi:ABC-2 type transport system permease protein